MKLQKKKILGATFVIAVVAIATTGAFALNDKYPSGTWRYKMTVEVETPEGVRSGSAVREVTVQKRPNIVPEQADVNIKVKGEAVVIDLGKRGTLFALMKNGFGSDYSYRIVFDALPFSGGALTVEGIHYYSTLKQGSAILKPQQYPEMVTFKNMTDPKTLALIYEQKPINIQNQPNFDYQVTDNFEKVYGNGVKIKDIKIEITNEPVTQKIERILPPFTPETGFHHWYKSLKYDDPLRLDRSVFIKG